MSRITIDVTVEQHQQVTAMAAIQGKTIKEFVMERLFSNDMDEEAQAMEELKTLLGERIREAETGHMIQKKFSDIADEKLRQMDAS